MQINGIAKQLLNPLSLGQTGNSGANSSTAAVLDRLKDAAGSPGGAAFHEILARYDVTAISPRDIRRRTCARRAISRRRDLRFDLRDLNQIVPNSRKTASIRTSRSIFRSCSSKSSPSVVRNETR